MPTLFDPIKLGALSLPSRIVMAPLTRCRAHPETRVPSDLAVEYYRQRASAGRSTQWIVHNRPRPRSWPAVPRRARCVIHFLPPVAGGNTAVIVEAGNVSPRGPQPRFSSTVIMFQTFTPERSLVLPGAQVS